MEKLKMDEREKIYRKVLSDLGKDRKLGMGYDSDLNFGKAAGTFVRSEKNCEWVDELANKRNQGNYDRDTPCGDLSDLVNEFLEAGVAPKDLASYTRIMQHMFLFHLLYMFDDPYNELIAANLEISEEWRIFKRDEHNPYAATEFIAGGLYELIPFLDENEE